MAYSTLKHTTKNEVGEHEVEIVYKNGLFRYLFNLPERKETYVSRGGVVWYSKGPAERASSSKSYEISNIIEYLRQQSLYNV